jgi:hypothetical protein
VIGLSRRESRSRPTYDATEAGAGDTTRPLHTDPTRFPAVGLAVYCRTDAVAAG